jgi:orotidine-5'-phosphate decarboxylase
LGQFLITILDPDAGYCYYQLRGKAVNFNEKLKNAMKLNQSLLCIGLDPDPALMPPGMDVFKFNKGIIDATADLVCAYKLNLGFYEVLDKGIDTLKRTIKYIPKNVPVIGDGKRGDIGNTAKAYAKAMFETLGFDAVTVSPYMGFDSVEPFIDYWQKGVFVLCRTSNPGAGDFQSLTFALEGKKVPLYEIVALRAEQWNKQGKGHNIGLVVGATYPEELALIRHNHPKMLLLIPGIGAQGGDLAAAVRKGVDNWGYGAIFTSSRQILYASKKRDFAKAAREVARPLRDEIKHLARTRKR